MESGLPHVRHAGDTITIAGTGGIAELSGRAMHQKQAVLYGRNVVRVNVDVFSTRLHYQDNLLDCALFDDEVTVPKPRRRRYI